MPKPNYWLFVCLFLLLSPLSQANSWTYQGQLVRSPYAKEQIIKQSLSFTRSLRKAWSTTLTIPLQLTLDPGPEKFKLDDPQLTLAWSSPKQNTTWPELGLAYSPSGFKFQGGIKHLVDPLLLYGSCQLYKKTLAFEGGVVFAANEKWALGAHLRYGTDSTLTYQLHHYLKGGQHVEFSYSCSLTGSFQSLGLKTSF